MTEQVPSKDRVDYLLAKLCWHTCTCQNANAPAVQHGVHCVYEQVRASMPTPEPLPDQLRHMMTVPAKAYDGELWVRAADVAPMQRELAKLRAAQPPGLRQLTDDEMLAAAVATGFDQIQMGSMFYDKGPYSITTPTCQLREFVKLVIDRATATKESAP